MEPKKPQVVAHDGSCSGGTCPTVWDMDNEFVFQGPDARKVMDVHGLALPVGELAVSIPKSVVEMLIRNIS